MSSLELRLSARRAGATDPFVAGVIDERERHLVD